MLKGAQYQEHSRLHMCGSGMGACSKIRQSPCSGNLNPQGLTGCDSVLPVATFDCVLAAMRVGRPVVCSCNLPPNSETLQVGTWPACRATI